MATLRMELCATTGGRSVVEHHEAQHGHTRLFRIFGAVLASLTSVRTRMIVIDTADADLPEDLEEPVDLLFGTQLGGGTDINRALAYCQTQIRRPEDTVLILVTDLYEGGNPEERRRRANALVTSGVQVVTLLALSDNGAPAYNHDIASAF